MEKNLINLTFKLKYFKLLTVSIDGSNWFFEISDIPEIQSLIFSSSGQEFGIRRNCDGVNLIFVGFQSVSDLEVSVPDLESSIPSD